MMKLLLLFGWKCESMTNKEPRQSVNHAYSGASLLIR